MFGKTLPRWFIYLGLAMLALRIGYKYYRSQQKPAYETQMADLETRNQALRQAIEADQQAQRAQGTAPITADPAAVAAADSAAEAQAQAAPAVPQSR